MKAGTYYFRILSPAKALNSKGFVNIGNGEYLLATDDRYTQTAMTAVTITKIDEGGTLNNVQTLYLPPSSTRQRGCSLLSGAGEGVHTLEMLAEGIEISGYSAATGQYDQLRLGKWRCAACESGGIRVHRYVSHRPPEMPITAWWRIPAYCPQTHALTLSVCC